jgi:hypothetical protein
MSDPFGDPFDEEISHQDVNRTEAKSVKSSETGTQVLLPISLCVVVFVGSLMPWVVVRPFTDTRSSYNLTDIAGGIGVLLTAALFVIVGAITLGFKHRVGLTIMSIAAGTLGWMATISGMLLGVVGSLLPSIKVAGIDLTKAQVGQGQGVAVSIVASLLLGILCVRRFEPISTMSPSIGIRVLPILAIIPLIALAVNHHAGWLVLGSEKAGWTAEVPGDSFYGSGIVLLLIYFCAGMWFVTFIVRTRILTICTSALSVSIAAVCGMYSIFVWVGGKALKWLIPSSIEGWSTVSNEMPLYLSFFGSIVLLVVAIVGFIPQISEKTFNLGSRVNIRSSKLSGADMVGIALLVLTAFSVILTLIL